MGIVRFGITQNLVEWIQDTLKVPTFVETGTNRAETAVWASAKFANVFTIEAFEPLFRAAVNKYSNLKNICFLHCESCTHLTRIVTKLDSQAVFWLDAHWCGENTHGISAECPVIEELRIINESPLPHIVLIDDARLFVAPPPLPHNADHWPDIAQVCQAVKDSIVERYIVIHDDVIIAVPIALRAQLINFVRDAATANSVSVPENLIVKRTILGDFLKFFRRKT